MILFRVSKIDIKRLNQTAVRPNPLTKVIFPNAERANKSTKNRKKEKAKPMCRQTSALSEILVEEYLAFLIFTAMSF